MVRATVAILRAVTVGVGVLVGVRVTVTLAATAGGSGSSRSPADPGGAGGNVTRAIGERPSGGSSRVQPASRSPKTTAASVVALESPILQQPSDAGPSTTGDSCPTAARRATRAASRDSSTKDMGVHQNGAVAGSRDDCPPRFGP
jgi:hypothetical protein